MGRFAAQLEHALATYYWPAGFLLHALLELSLGGAKLLHGRYKFEARQCVADLKARGKGNAAARRADRVKLMQYTRYHGLARIALALLGGLALWGADATHTGTACACAFWHGGAALVQVVHLSTYPDVAKASPTLLLHALLALFFVHFCLTSDGTLVGAAGVHVQ